MTEVAEAVSKQLDSHVMIVGAGQSALTDVPLLQKLMDRFTIRVPLSDADVETVTRKVLLQKKPTSVGDVRALLDKHAGEVSRQLQGTRIGESRRGPRRHRRRLPAAAGSPALLGELLPADRCRRHAQPAALAASHHSRRGREGSPSAPLGAVVAGDELFEALAPEMVNTGVLLREINERIIFRSARTEGAAGAAHLRPGLPDRQADARRRGRHRRPRHEGSPRRSSGR